MYFLNYDYKKIIITLTVITLRSFTVLQTKPNAILKHLLSLNKLFIAVIWFEFIRQTIFVGLLKKRWDVLYY